MREAPAHEVRLERARRCVAALAAREREGVLPAIRLLHEPDMRAGLYVVRARPAHPIPDEVVVEVAGALHDLRRSLDDLATACAGRPVKFPIHESLALFAQRARKAIARMPDAAQAAIEALQPYHAIGGYRNGPLWLLDQLAAQSPVRLVAAIADEGAGLVPPELGVNTRRKVELLGDPELATGAFDVGAVLASQRFRIVGPDPKIDMYFRTAFVLAFDPNGPGRGRGVTRLLREFADHVEAAVVPALAQHLPPA